ncbi:MAG: serine protease [Anaerolineales bacterium]|nr:serine protease [Anaerolineales bacterium]
MNANSFKPFIWLGVLILVVSMACSLFSGGTPEEDNGLQADSRAVSKLEDVRNAVIQIEAQGTFVNPDFTVSYNVVGTGSGFIIDPSGIAVTNNHVVTGAALLRVWVGGDRNQTYNARVLGVSECSDLAVIAIDGEDFAYLEWYGDPINVGLEVYAAGFPLGEPQFTLAKGIVSKERAGGETSWASVSHVIEHDATINPGNSGGPLVTASGKVVGVNYRGRETNQYYAIGRDIGSRVVEQLREGKDLDSFGVNGEAFAVEGFSGIWVYSVKSGSPADEAGIKGGDIITTLEDLVVGTDGSMVDYCDILRSHSSSDILNVEVIRYASGEILQGQINGRPLEAVFSFEQGLESEFAEEEEFYEYSGYVTVTDDYGAIQISIPIEWDQVDGSSWTDGVDVIGSAISASGDLDGFLYTWDESGVFFGASDELAKFGGFVQLLDITRDDFTSDCKLEGRYDYEDPAYRGKYDLYSNCGNQGTLFIVLTAVPIDDPQAYLILVEIQITKDADFEALEMILDTFVVVGTLP